MIKKQLIDLLTNELSNEGYNFKYTVEPKLGGNGEYNVYNIFGNSQKRLVFTNDENLKQGENANAVYGSYITSGNVKDVVALITNKK